MALPAEVIEVLFAAGSAFVGFMIWLIRLEGKTNYNEAAVKELKIKHEALDNKIVDKLSVIEKSLAKIEGRLSIETEPKGGVK